MGTGDFADIKVSGQVHMSFHNDSLWGTLTEISEDDCDDETGTSRAEEELNHQGLSCCINDGSDEVDEAKEACNYGNDAKEDGYAS